MNDELIKKADIRKIADEGTKIYNKIKVQYDPKENGKFLAIDIDTEQAYLGNTGVEAIQLAKQNHPDKIFYLVKIGYDVAETVAKAILAGKY